MKTHEEIVAVCKMLGDRTRLEIVQLLLQEEQCICELVEHFKISQPAISKHIRKLKETGMLLERKQSQWKHYRFNEAYASYDLVKTICKDLEKSDKKSEMNCSDTTI